MRNHIRGLWVGTALAGLAAAIPGALLERIDGGGHLLHARHPVRVNLLIQDFLRQLARRERDARPGA